MHRATSIAALSLFASLLHSQARAQDSAPTPPPPAETPAAAPFDVGPPARRARPHEPVELSAENADLTDLVRMMTRITGRRFLLSGARREIRATIASSEPVTAAEAYQAFLAMLHQNGMTVVRRGRYHVITETEQIARRPTPIAAREDALGDDESFVTWIEHVEHAAASDAVALLEALRSTDGQVIAHPSTGAIVIVDTSANVERMRRILREVDVPQGGARIWIGNRSALGEA